MQKCIWCNKKNDELREIFIPNTNPSASKLHEISCFVCPEHEQKLRKFFNRARRYALLFIGLMVLSLISLIISGGYSNRDWSENAFIASFASIGLIIIIFPFCTPQTIAMIGVAKSIIIARIIGGIIFAAGIYAIIQNLLHGS
jgi:hypothetical protein